MHGSKKRLREQVAKPAPNHGLQSDGETAVAYSLVATSEVGGNAAPATLLASIRALHHTISTVFVTEEDRQYQTCPQCNGRDDEVCVVRPTRTAVSLILVDRMGESRCSLLGHGGRRGTIQRPRRKSRMCCFSCSDRRVKVPITALASEAG